jgi:ABC-type Fe2+-enterobactin transport system substrate-binding protein
MRSIFITGSILLAYSLSGCTVVSVAGTVVSTAVSVTGTVISTTAEVVGAGVKKVAGADDSGDAAKK